MALNQPKSYSEYLRTPHWRRLRDRKIADAGACCERCGEFGRRGIGGVWLGLHVHHLTYERIGNELLEDLQVLCVCCHEEEHGIAEASEERREAVRRSISRKIAARVTYDAADEIDEGIAAWDQIILAADGGLEL